MAEPGLRERKKRQTRERIEGTALRLFDRHGFDAVTIEDISAGAEVAPRTFFHYFATKDDVVLADYAERLRQLLDALAGRPSDEAPWTALREAFRFVASQQSMDHGGMAVRLRIMASTPSVAARSLLLQAGWERDLATLLRSRGGVEDAADLATGLLAASALAAMRASMQRWSTDQSLDLASGVDRSFDLLGAGLDLIR